MGCTTTPEDQAKAPTPEVETVSSSEPAPTAGSAAGKSSGEKVTLDGRELTLPPGLKFPDGIKVGSTSTDGDTLTVVLTAPPSAEVLKHFSTNLPFTGFAVATGADTPNELALDGKGWSGSMAGTPAGETTLKFWPTRPEPVDSDELTLANVPFFLKFPGGTKMASLSDPKTGASIKFAAPAPAEVLRFYREAANGPLWDLVKDTTSSGTTTLVFADHDGWTVTVTTTATTAALATKAP